MTGEIIDLMYKRDLNFTNVVTIWDRLGKKYLREDIEKVLNYFLDRGMLCRVRDKRNIKWLNLYAVKIVYVDKSNTKWDFAFPREKYVMGSEPNPKSNQFP